MALPFDDRTRRATPSCASPRPSWSAGSRACSTGSRPRCSPSRWRPGPSSRRCASGAAPGPTRRRGPPGHLSLSRTPPTCADRQRPSGLTGARLSSESQRCNSSTPCGEPGTRPRRRRGRHRPVGHSGRSPTCTPTPSSRCSTARPGSSDLVAAAVADGQPALGITDHGNMYGVLDFYKACRDAGHHARSSAPRPTWPPSRATSARSAGARSTTPAATSTAGEKLYYHLTLLAETDRRLPQPAQAVVGRLPRGLLLQAPGRLGAARAPPRGPDRHHRLPRRRGAPGAARPATIEAARAKAGPPPGHLRARQPLRRAAGPRPRRAAPDQPAADRDRPPHRRPAAGHQRQPLHPPRGRRGPRRPAVRADRARSSTTPSASSSRATSTT